MRLIQFRIVGHQRHPDTTWRPVGRGVTLLDWDSETLAAEILFALQSINPPYDMDAVQPFAQFQKYIQTGTSTKKVIPSKKTAAFAVYARTLPLVRELATIDPVLYETDRIELGRRRDHSRWSNFVEIASSSRWSEVQPLVEQLLTAASTGQAKVLQGELAGQCAMLKSTDRVKGELAGRLSSLLSALSQQVDQSLRQTLEQALYTVHRHDRFTEARRAMIKHLPLFLYLSDRHLDQNRFAVEDLVTPAAGNGRRDPLGYLLAELFQGEPPESGLEGFVERVNSTLNQYLPDREELPRFVLENNCIRLILVSGLHSLELGQLAPVRAFIILVETAMALHMALKKTNPIVLLHPRRLAATAEENISLLKGLAPLFRKDQALLAPSPELLKVYRENRFGQRVRCLGLE